MKFSNNTPFPGFLFRTPIDDRRMAAAAIVRATFDLEPRNLELKPALKQLWRVSPTPWSGPKGPMESDAQFDRQGCDLLVFGRARSPNGHPIPVLDIRITVGKMTHALRVFGDRCWERQADGRWAPSAPAPFTEIPLDLEHAFGGCSQWDGLTVPFADNPAGKGFACDESVVEGLPLPNVEDPRKPIIHWNQHPDPVGVCMVPRRFGPRVRRAVVTDRAGRLVDVRPAIHNVAFPDMITDEVSPGDRVVVQGMTRLPLEFHLPRIELTATTRVGEVEHTDPLRFDQVGIEVDEARIFITYRYTCTYVLRPNESRTCAIHWRGGRKQEI